MARHPHLVTEPFAFTFLIRLDRRLAPASRALTRNQQQLDPANFRGRNCFGGECPQRRAHLRFRRSPRKNSHRNDAWTYLGRDAEGGVLSKGGSQDECGGATVGGMRRRILRMRRSPSEFQQWPPIGVRVSRRGPRSVRGDWPPENIAVLAIPARRYRVGESRLSAQIDVHSRSD